MREESKLRKGDEIASDAVSEFIEDKFYKKECTFFERIKDLERQVKGIDVIFDFDDKRYLCDEKSTVRYANRYLATFAMELSFIGKMGNQKTGWLLDPEKINDSFLLIWVDKALKDEIETKQDVVSIEIALVRKEKIVAYLENLGWTFDKLMVKNKRIRDNYDEFCGNINKNGCKFSISRQLVEKPINVLIPRNKLIEISDVHRILKSDE